jgi:hypothetical protein
MFYRVGYPVLEEDSELSEDGVPIPERTGPFLLEATQRQVEQLGDGLVVWEVAAVVQQLAQARVEGLDLVGRVDHAPDLGREVEEWHDAFPVRSPGRRDHLVAAAPLLVEGVERCLGGFTVGGRVDRLEVLGDDLAILVAD